MQMAYAANRPLGIIDPGIGICLALAQRRPLMSIADNG